MYSLQREKIPLHIMFFQDAVWQTGMQQRRGDKLLTGKQFIELFMIQASKDLAFSCLHEKAR